MQVINSATLQVVHKGKARKALKMQDNQRLTPKAWYKAKRIWQNR